MLSSHEATWTRIRREIIYSFFTHSDHLPWISHHVPASAKCSCGQRPQDHWEKLCWPGAGVMQPESTGSSDASQCPLCSKGFLPSLECEACASLVYSFYSWANTSLIKRQTSVSRSEVHSGRWVFWGGQADASRWPLHCERWMPVSSVRLQGNTACSGNYSLQPTAWGRLSKSEC